MSDPTDNQNQSRSGASISDQAESASSTLKTITRLLVGGVLLGADVLLQRLETWEHDVDARQSNRNEGLAQGSNVTRAVEVQPEPTEPRSDQTRYALLGLLFQSQTALKKGTQTLSRAEQTAWKLMTPVHKPLGTWRVFAPARRRYERLVARGEVEVSRWVVLGRAEARRSRALAETAIYGTIDESIDFVATNPQVRDTLQQTSTSLAGEVSDEVRARTVSSDALMEGLARRLFRRPPREYPPEPPITLEMLENDRTRRD